MNQCVQRYSGICCSFLVVFVLLFCFCSVGYADFGLDPYWGDGGFVTTDFDGGADNAFSLLLDNSNRMLVTGYCTNGSEKDFGIVRYLEDGTLDTSFGDGGLVSTDFFGSDDSGQSSMMDRFGNIVVAGYCWNSSHNDFALARYLETGDLDPSFGYGGIVSTDLTGPGKGDYIYSCAMDSSDRIVVAGICLNGSYYDFALARYLRNGNLDPSFGNAGIVSTDVSVFHDYAYSCTVDSEDRIVVAGSCINSNYDFVLARYLDSGDLDSEFGNNGIVSTDFNLGNDQARSLAIDGTGRIIVAGHSTNGSNYNFALACYLENGDLDLTFGNNGLVTTDFAGGSDSVYSCLIDSEGGILVVGDCGNGTGLDFALARYTANGVLDTNFGNGGLYYTDFDGESDFGRSCAISDTGEIFVAGYTDNGTDNDFALARYGEFEGTSSGGGGGCNLSALPAMGLLLLMPLMFLSRKKK